MHKTVYAVSSVTQTHVMSCELKNSSVTIGSLTSLTLHIICVPRKEMQQQLLINDNPTKHLQLEHFGD